MHVKTTNHMGDDLTVVNAARVSFAKESAAQDQVEGLGQPSVEQVC